MRCSLAGVLLNHSLVYIAAVLHLLQITAVSEGTKDHRHMLTIMASIL